MVRNSLRTRLLEKKVNSEKWYWWVVVLLYHLVRMHQSALKPCWLLEHLTPNQSLVTPRLPGMVLELEERLELTVSEFDPMAVYQ